MTEDNRTPMEKLRDLAASNEVQGSKTGSGDTGAGLAADGKDNAGVVNKPSNVNASVTMKRLLGTEEIEVKVSRQSLRVVDKNGRKLEVGQVVNLKVKILSFGADNQVEVVYPPYVVVDKSVEAEQHTMTVKADKVERF